jgi:hypothetical protein
VPLCYGVTGYAAPSSIEPGFNTCNTAPVARKLSPKAKALMAGWMKKKAELFAGKYHLPDAEDADTVSHYDWYEATDFQVPFPGEKAVRPASDFKRVAALKADLDD